MSTTPLAKVAFVHVPRTGGTTFGSILDRLYEGRKVARFYGDANSNVANERIEQFRRLDAGEKQSFDLLRGHFVFGFDDSLEAFQYITLLREPVQRLVSYYFYALKDKSNYLHEYLMKRRVNLVDFITSGLSIELDNYQVRTLSGVAFSSVRERVGREHCELAKDNLARRFAAFGLVERFDASIAVFARHFGWHIPGYEPQNLGGYAGTPHLSQSTIEAVAATNPFDLELYEYAKELFDARNRQTSAAEAAS
jgi:hypothetical protein